MTREVINLNVPYELFDCKRDDVKATLTVYNYNEGEFAPMEKRPAAIVCPGGAYFFLCEREAEPVAREFAKNGVRPFLLEYSVVPNKFPAALMEVAQAVRYVREHSEELGVDKDRIIVSGSSAGGHLAASIGTLWNEPFLSEALDVSAELIKPNGIILSYPVITAGEYTHLDSLVNLVGDHTLEGDGERREFTEKQEYFRYISLEKQVDGDSAKTFIWTTVDDTLVPMENSLLFVKALRDARVPVEFHLFPYADHGMSLANEEASRDEQKRDVDPYIARWFPWAIEWIRKMV